MDAHTRLQKAVADLDDLKIALLAEMAASLFREVAAASPLRASDIASKPFLEDFSNRLLIHHATNEERLNKKTFEYLFVASSTAAGRKASRVSLDDHPHADVVVNGTTFSLKTEASASISERTITISKLAEARWIRECRSGQDFIRGLREKVVPHLESYDRILTLRAFDLGARRLRYDLVEIPRDLLLNVRNLVAGDFSPRTINNSTKASVKKNGRQLFSLRLDGSVEKITVAGLGVRDCISHATWQLSMSD